jgi:hypothetical protein
MPLLSAHSRAPFVVAALFAAGCSAPVVDDVAAAAGSTTQGIILVERATTVEGAPQTHVSAKFMRLPAGVDPDLAERVVGSRLDLPAAGECMVVAPLANEDTSSALSALGAVELLDVGDLTLKTGDSVTPLAARAFPDAFGLVSGVFYTSRDAADDLPAPAKYVLEGSGSASIERFSIEADAPAAPSDVLVGDAPLGDEVVIEGGALVRWRSDTSVGAQAGDLVYVDITAASGAALRCAFSDEGHGEVPASMLRSGVLGALPAAATLAVHRVRLGAFVGPGIDLGEVRFDLSVVGRATIAE